MNILKQLAMALNRSDHEPKEIDSGGGYIVFTLDDDPYCFDLANGTLIQYTRDGLTVVYEWKVKVTII